MKPELPEIRRALLTQDDVDALFRDISILVELHSVHRRGVSDRDECASTLPDARETLRSSRDYAIQLRYAHDDHDWIDTLVPEGEHIELTRIAVQYDAAQDDTAAEPPCH